LPLKSRYKTGIRYCEHCQQEVKQTKERGEVILTFEYPLKAEGRQFILSNPDFEHQDHPIEVTKVYIDTHTSDRRLLERFLTYIVNYPPTRGLQSIQVFYTGNLDHLGTNLKNAFQNTFRHLEQKERATAENASSDNMYMVSLEPELHSQCGLRFQEAEEHDRP
jgi:hypothetical protein